MAAQRETIKKIEIIVLLPIFLVNPFYVLFSFGLDVWMVLDIRRKVEFIGSGNKIFLTDQF